MAEHDDLWLDAGQQASWRALMMGMTLLRDRLDDDLQRGFGVSLSEYEVLVRLSERDGEMRMAQLADSLAHSRSRVTHTVKRMESLGLLERCEADGDRRGIVARITGTGWERLRAMAPVHVRGVRDHLVDLVSPQDFAALGRVMDAVADHLVAAHPEMEIRTGR